MRKLDYTKANAFTFNESKGNPAAFIMVGGEPLTPGQMLGIAKEHQGFVSEVVFVSESDKAQFKLTYYSSECEVEFCGHGTIATMHQLIKNSPELLEKEEIEIETNCTGVLKVYNNVKSDDAVFITAPEHAELENHLEKSGIAAILGINESDISDDFPVRHVECGLKTLIVPIKSLDRETSIFPDLEKLKDFCKANGLQNFLIFSKETADKSASYHTRVFAPTFGYLEDPATGSSNSAFGYYLLSLGLWNGEAMNLEQGGKDRIFNIVKLKTKDSKVLFGGSSKATIKGEYLL